MRSTISTYDPTLLPINIQTGGINDFFRIWMHQVTERGLLIGTDSPENVVIAQQGIFYLDETGAVGSVFYIKQVADILGDRTKGWVAIG